MKEITTILDLRSAGLLRCLYPGLLNGYEEYYRAKYGESPGRTQLSREFDSEKAAYILPKLNYKSHRCIPVHNKNSKKAKQLRIIFENLGIEGSEENERETRAAE